MCVFVCVCVCVSTLGGGIQEGGVCCGPATRGGQHLIDSSNRKSTETVNTHVNTHTQTTTTHIETETHKRLRCRNAQYVQSKALLTSVHTVSILCTSTAVLLNTCDDIQ